MGGVRYHAPPGVMPGVMAEVMAGVMSGVIKFETAQPRSP